MEKGVRTQRQWHNGNSKSAGAQKSQCEKQERTRWGNWIGRRGSVTFFHSSDNLTALGESCGTSSRGFGGDLNRDGSQTHFEFGGE